MVAAVDTTAALSASGFALIIPSVMNGIKKKIIAAESRIRMAG